MSLEAAGIIDLSRPNRFYRPNLAIEAEPCCLCGSRWHCSPGKGLASEETRQIFRRLQEVGEERSYRMRTFAWTTPHRIPWDAPDGLDEESEHLARFRLKLGSLLPSGPVEAASMTPLQGPKPVRG